MNLYVKFGKQETIEKFIEKFYSLIGSQRRDAVETYHDEKCSNKHCDEKRYRSFDDILDLVNTYYPGTSPKDLFHILLTIKLPDINGRILYLHMSNCSTIERIRMLYYYDEKSSYQGRTFNKKKSKYSWLDLLGMLNLESIEAIQAYVKRH